MRTQPYINLCIILKNDGMKTHLLFLFQVLFFTTASAQIINFPDPNFKAKLLQANSSNTIASTETPLADGSVSNYHSIDTNNDGEIQLSEANAIKYLSVTSSDIVDLEGISFFENLQVLRCGGSNLLTSINLDGLTSLLYLDCSFNQLTSMDISDLSALQTLKCRYNLLTSIDTSGLTNLQAFDCSGNQLTSIDISGLTNLQSLDCNSNQLTSINTGVQESILALDCSYNQLTSIDVSGLTNLQSFDCRDNQIVSIILNTTQSLVTLNCSRNDLTNIDISGLTNLQTYNCSGNQLTSINLNGLQSLISLNCSINLLTSIDLNEVPNLQILNCSINQLSNIDVNDLTNLQILNCDNNLLLNLNVIGLNNLQKLYCENNQLESLDVSNLTSLKFLHCSNNQITTLNLVNSLNIEELLCNNNQLQTIFVNHLVNLKYLKLNSNLLTTLDVNNSSNLILFGCSNNQLTSLFIKNNGSSSMSGYSFFNNPNLNYVCADESDLAAVQQKVNSYGYGSTCMVNSYCNFTPGGTYYTIQGNNKIDSNSNGCDNSDFVYPNLKYSITNGSVTGSLISDSSGSYEILVQEGTHTITPQFENPTYFTVSPLSTEVSFPASTSPYAQDFCMTPNGVHHDLEVVIIPVTVARPGFDATYKIKYKNKGSVSESVILNFNYDDAILDYSSSTLVPTSTNTGSLSWNIGTIAPLQSGEFLLIFNINSPMDTPSVNGGDVLNYTATINGLNTDETPNDNIFELNQEVVNSFDPNDKTCLEGSIINVDKIGEYVHYQIRFENTGTFAAQNIVVKDMIDTTKFDLSTIQITDASHSCVARITDSNKVEFIFEGINLPFDDANNDGYVVFKIKTKSTLVTGNTISNSANIYFDYNFPIVTNTATSTFQALNNDTNEFDGYFAIYPNPVKDILNITSKQTTDIRSLLVYNLLGQLIQTVINPKEQVDVSHLKTGNYIIKVITDNGILSSNFIKE